MSWERYSRQILFNPIGNDGQEKLNQTRALVVGAGALGTVIANHLARAGVGYIRIVDRDYVEKSNLQRQMLYTEDDVNAALPKAVAAEQKLKQINSDIEVEGIVADLNNSNIHQLFEDVDIVLDGTDNFSTRFLINDACFQKGIPFAYGGAVSSRGMTALFIPDATPCLNCMINQGAGRGQTCDTVGVISPVVDMVASLQVTEAIKYLVGDREHLLGAMRTFDIWNNHSFDIKFGDPKTDCPTCQKKEYPFLKQHAEDHVSVMCGRDTVQIQHDTRLDLDEWKERLERVAEIKKTPFLLKAILKDGITLVLFPDGRILVQGTEEINTAKSIYDRYIGS